MDRGMDCVVQLHSW